MGVTEDIAGLPTCSRAELVQLWRELWKREPPYRMGRDLMMLAIAWQMQARARGMQWRRPGKSSSAMPTIVVRPGTKFIREYKGELHVVVASEEGYMWQGKCYRSLSVIARTITGMRWSGPKFFGLGGRKA